MTPFLLELMDHPDPSMRFYSAFVFQELRDERAMSSLAERAFDPDSDVRVVALGDFSQNRTNRQRFERLDCFSFVADERVLPESFGFVVLWRNATCLDGGLHMSSGTRFNRIGLFSLERLDPRLKLVEFGFDRIFPHTRW